MPDESFWAFDDDEKDAAACGRTLQILLTKAEQVEWGGLLRSDDNSSESGRGHDMDHGVKGTRSG